MKIDFEGLPLVSTHPRVRAMEGPFRRLMRAVKTGEATPEMAERELVEFLRARRSMVAWLGRSGLRLEAGADLMPLMKGLVAAINGRD